MASIEGSRRERKKTRTRGEIFRAAMELFGRRGFDAVTVEQICAAADVAKGTFFQHFPSKAALLAEWDRELAAELGERLRDPRHSALAQYRTVIDQLVLHWERRPDAVRALLGELVTTSEDGTREAGGLRGAIEAVVRRGQERGELRANASPRLAAAMLLAACAAAFSLPREDAVTVRNELLHALLQGLREPKPRLKWRPS